MALQTIRSLFKRPLSSSVQATLAAWKITTTVTSYETKQQNSRSCSWSLENHEFYETTFNSGLEKAKQLETEPYMSGRLVILHQRRYDIPDSGVTILDCTLWSQIPQEPTDIVDSKISDFQKIKEWSVEQHNKAHDSDLTWLRGVRSKLFGRLPRKSGLSWW
ncbi:hypothetical protein N7449_007814 [Penicillium cf. viridicatum]|uniref:Uncharacterized protein n=1 Tax=Penicillium cf. viridicatum TaxID=2972119 RepID=A0A9W9MCF2_9EURO|nr:hypothetical protein N7449_007814 [Penicillium cf. viridicatum]